MIIDQSGSLANVKRHDYLPFGEELFAGMGARTQQQGFWSNDGIRQQFTQKERDVETGLDYFLARYCSSTQGRFTSPDPTLLSVNGFNPQTWNRYTYVLNNPLAYVDPLGLWALQSQTIYRTDANGNEVLDRRGRRIVERVVVTAVRTSDKDTAASLAKQLGLTGRNAEDFAQRVGDGNNIRLSEQGNAVGRVFTAVEKGLKEQAKFEIEHPDRQGQGPDSADCSETACRIAFQQQMFGTQSFSVQEADAMISAQGETTSVQENDLRSGDIVRWADAGNNPKHFATFIFRNDDGVPVVFSKSGKGGPYETATTNEIGAKYPVYGTIRGINSGQSGYYHPR
jgi:RHS repeat-associated protein